MLTDELKLSDKEKEYKKKVDNFGKTTIKKVENTSKMFGSTVNQVANSMEYSNDIEKDITNLNEIVKKLDPSGVDFTVKKRLFFNPVKKYFNRIKSEESNIRFFIENLKKERDILKRDNITLEIEIKNLDSIIKHIDIEYENGLILKNEIDESLKNLKDKSKENYYIQNYIEPLDKRLYDLKQMAIIKQQSVLALEIICRNNREIIRNLEKIQNVTMEALNTAIMMANSLHNQKVVLNKVQKSDAFENFYQTINDAESQNKTKFPEIKSRIIEIKQIEDI